jgi:hypothetical protein
MGTWPYNPSEGLLLKFSGDLVYLVLIRGSNLAKPLSLRWVFTAIHQPVSTQG